MSHAERQSRFERYEQLDLGELLALERKTRPDVDLLVGIGRRYLELRQLDKCYRYYSRALALDPDDGWTHLYFGNLTFVLSCYDQAENHFRRAAELLPDVACPYWCLADLYEAQGYWSRTEEYYRQAVDVDPTDATAQRKLEQWLAQRGD